jgi:hypothetical protein
LVVKIREGKERPEWLREDFWNELSEHTEKDDMKAKLKFMSDIAKGRPAADGPVPIIAITVGAELVSLPLYLLCNFCKHKNMKSKIFMKLIC